MNDNLKKILTFISVPVAGYILLMLTFVLDFLFQSILNRFFSAYYNNNMTIHWFPASKHLWFAVIIVIISWFIFKSKKLKELYKAVYAVVPTAVVLVTVGIFLYKWPAVAYTAGVLIYGTIIFYLYKNKKSWVFYYSVTLVAIVLLIMSILGIDI